MNRLWRTGLMLVLAIFARILLTACGGSSPNAEVAPGSAERETAETVIVPRPTAPAAEDEDFRPDSYTQVANTGRPQLLEVWEYS